MVYELVMRDPKQSLKILDSYDNKGEIQGYRKTKMSDTELFVNLHSEEDYTFIKNKMSNFISRDSGMVQEGVEDVEEPTLGMPKINKLQLRQHLGLTLLHETISDMITDKAKFDQEIKKKYGESIKQTDTKLDQTLYQIGNAVYAIWDKKSKGGYILAENKHFMADASAIDENDEQLNTVLGSVAAALGIEESKGTSILDLIKKSGYTISKTK